jgi:hypothetical protein
MQILSVDSLLVELSFSPSSSSSSSLVEVVGLVVVTSSHLIACHVSTFMFCVFCVCVHRVRGRGKGVGGGVGEGGRGYQMPKEGERGGGGGWWGGEGGIANAPVHESPARETFATPQP